MDGFHKSSKIRSTRRLTRLDLKILRIKEKHFAIGKKKTPDEEQKEIRLQPSGKADHARLVSGWPNTVLHCATLH